jgi:hypothetical protein
VRVGVWRGRDSEFAGNQNSIVWKDEDVTDIEGGFTGMRRWKWRGGDAVGERPV